MWLWNSESVLKKKMYITNCFFSIFMYLRIMQQLVDQRSMQVKSLLLILSLMWFYSPENSQISLSQQVCRTEILTVILEKLTHRQILIQRSLKDFTLASHWCEIKSRKIISVQILWSSGGEQVKKQLKTRFSLTSGVFCVGSDVPADPQTHSREREKVSANVTEYSESNFKNIISNLASHSCKRTVPVSSFFPSSLRSNLVLSSLISLSCSWTGIFKKGNMWIGACLKFTL